MVVELYLRLLLPSDLHLQLFLDTSIHLNSELEPPIYKHMSQHWATVVTASIPTLTLWIYSGCNPQVDDWAYTKWDRNPWPDKTPFMVWCVESDWGPCVLWEMAVETGAITNDAQNLKPYAVFYEEKEMKDVFPVGSTVRIWRAWSMLRSGMESVPATIVWPFRFIHRQVW